MRYPLTQKRFTHRRHVTSAQPSVARRKARQSTLTQLDFVSTPPPQYESSDDLFSDEENELPSTKRRKIECKSSTRKRKDNTLTQIGFVASTYGKDEDTDDEAIVKDSQHESEVAASPVRPRRSPDIHSSPLPVATTRNLEMPRTPTVIRTEEAPSSQTPASIALSSIHKVRSGQLRSSSPLQAKSSNSHTASTRKLRRVTTIPNSDSEDIDLIAELDDDVHNKAPACTYMPTQAQFTYDPADAALDRDAARAAWTQARANTVGDTLSDDEDLVLAAQTMHPPKASQTLQDQEEALPVSVLRPSQISTVAPTQESLPPLVFTSATTERQHKETVLISSSPLPVPPWTEQDAGAWDSLDSNRDKAAEPQTLSDFSLPPPPGLFWSSPMYTSRRT